MSDIEATTPYLNAEPRSREAAALAVARRALRQIASGFSADPDSKRVGNDALHDIATILGEEEKQP